MNSDLFDFKREAYEDEFEDAIGEGECEEEETGRVTGPPARNHWKVCWSLILCWGAWLGCYMCGKYTLMGCETLLASCVLCGNVIANSPCVLQPDSEATVCDSPSCIKQFSFYVRRHHCRR
jgi:hypothetical protein